MRLKPTRPASASSRSAVRYRRSNPQWRWRFALRSSGFRTAEQQVAAAQAAQAQSEEGLRILKNRYDAGLATMTDLLSAETARSSAQTNLAEALYRQRLSYAQIEYAAGIFKSDIAGNDNAIAFLGDSLLTRIAVIVNQQLMWVGALAPTLSDHA